LRKPKLGPCHNPQCPYDGKAPFIELDWPAKLRISGLCDGCKADDEKRELEEDERRRSELLDKLAGRKMRDWSLDTYPGDTEAVVVRLEALDWLDGYRADGRSNLIIHGDVGVGKTGIAWALLRDVIEKDEIPAAGYGFINFRDYLEEMKRAFGTNTEPDRRAHTRRLLVLDDLGAERPTDFARNELAALVEHRYQNELPTIVTSNYAPSELARRLGHDDPIVGQRIVSRLVENSVRINARGDDRR
jgi:DNA replication protein DnaC